MRDLILAALLLLMVVSGTFAASDTTALAAPPNDWHYTILSPRTIRPSSSYTFTVNFKAPQNSSSREAKVRASIVYWYSNKVNETKVMVSRNVSVKSGDQKLFYMQIPNSNALRNYKYSFNFSAEVQFNGRTFNHSSHITPNRKIISIFILTDKKLYKPGQLIRYRVIILDNKLKPYQKPFNLTIEDKNDNLIVQKINPGLHKGVYSGELQLSKVTPLGFWKINVETKEESHSETIEVAEYVLPKYEVKVELPKSYLVYESGYNDDVQNISSKQEDLRATVTAKYTYGEPVKGVALISFKLRAVRYKKSDHIPSINKMIQLTDGKADVSVSYKDLLNLFPCSDSFNRLLYQTIEVEAFITEQVSGKVLQASSSVACTSQRYNFQFFRTSTAYKPGFPFVAYLKLSHNELPTPMLKDLKYFNGTFKKIPVSVTFHVRNYSSSLEKSYMTEFNELGEAVISLDIDKNIKSLSLNAKYKDDVLDTFLYASHYASEFANRDRKFLQLSAKVLDDVLKPDKNTTFIVRTTEPIKYFFYQILSKSFISQAKVVKSDKASSLHEFTIVPSKQLALELAPRVKILAYYVNTKDEVVADAITVNVEDYLVNKLSIAFDKNSTSPSKPIVLNVEAEKDSFVGIAAVDKSVLLLHAPTQLSKLVSAEMSKFGSSSSYWYDYRDDGIYIPPAHFTDTDELFNSLNLVTFTSSLIYKYRYVHEEVFDSASDYAEEAPAPMAVRESFAGKKSLSSTTTHASHYNRNSNNNNMDSPTPREDFPETWIWSDLTVDENGRQKLELKVPDTITSWSASAFATHNQMGLGVVDGPVEVQVTKPLFVSLNLPYSITRGEEFALQANVFNYFDQDVEVVVKLPQSDYFKTRSCDVDLKQLQSVNLSKTVKISRNSAGSVYFWIVPTKLGQIPLFVSAHAGFAADAVKELILVKPEGVEKNYETTSFFKTSLTEPQQFSTNISVPDDYVEGSAVVEVFAIGDILAPTLRNLGNLVRFPSGCGEQNMVNFAPNVHILKYMKAVDQLDELKEKEILNGLQSGYQRQLTYKRNDGSYSAFGNDDAAGSVWLSAFVLKSFRQAQAYIPVTNENLIATVKWLLKHQHVDGYFLDPPLSRIIHSKMQGGANSRISVTAYTLIALHENKALHASKVNVKSSIRKATQYLEREFVHYNDDPYVLGIVAYAFYCVGSSKMERVLNKLYSFAITEDEKTHWKQPMPHDQEEDAWLLKEFASPYDIELTSYVLLLRASQKNLNLSLPIARWLIGQMSGIGGFVSTQDTVLALEAMTKFAPLVAFKDDSEGIKIKILGEYGEKHELATINKDNLLVLQTVQLNDKTRKILAFAEGDGFALLQTSVRYNRLNLTNSKFLRLDVSAETQEHYLNLTVSTSWLGEEQSGMVLLEINIPTGFALKDQDEFKQKLKLTDFRNFEITPQKIVVYLSELNYSATEFNTTLEQILAVHDVKPALVQVYRYYQPNEKVSAFYSPEGKKSWVSSCPQCCE